MTDKKTRTSRTTKPKLADPIDLTPEMIEDHIEYAINGKFRDNNLKYNLLVQHNLSCKHSYIVREMLTIIIGGREHNPNKLGYDAIKENVESKSTVYSKNCRIRASYNTTDYTLERLMKDRNNNVVYLCSGFTDFGRLIFIFEIPFSAIDPKFQIQINKWLAKQKRAKKPKKGNYLRSANFSYLDFIDHPETKVIFYNPEFSNYVVCNLKAYLNEKTGGNRVSPR